MRGGCPQGFTLAEVLISILLIAIAVLSVFSIQLATRVQTKKTILREQAAQFNRSLQERLRNFVRPATDALPPGGPDWHLPGDDCGTPGVPADDFCWALDTLGGEEHDATNALNAAGTLLLPADFRAAPSNGKLKYKVVSDLVNGKPVRRVEVRVTWDEVAQ